ncbi:MAG: hypothetical protein RL115_1647, partial [Bacteroidota bacterium]
KVAQINQEELLALNIKHPVYDL